MAGIKRFEDIEAWALARELDRGVFKAAGSDGLSKDLVLKRQMLKSSGSIMDNIAEGFERGSKGEFITFLGYAKGSAGELRSQLYRALDRSYVGQAGFEAMLADVTGISRRLQRLIEYFNASRMDGVRRKQVHKP
jgi:four helix bundle protein